MQRLKVIAASLLALFMVSGCNNKSGNLAPLEKLAEVPAINEGEFVAALPAELAGKPITESTTASVDSINSEEMTDDLRWNVQPGAQIVISGWAFDQQKPAGRIYIELANSDNRYFAIASVRTPRADVAQKHNIESLDVGFQATAMANIKPGAYRIAVVQLSDGGVSRWESPARVIVDEK